MSQNHIKVRNKRNVLGVRTTIALKSKTFLTIKCTGMFAFQVHNFISVLLFQRCHQLLIRRLNLGNLLKSIKLSVNDINNNFMVYTQWDLRFMQLKPGFSQSKFFRAMVHTDS